MRARALREAQASARLNNPATVTVYDVIEESGAIWLVMELVDGPNLAQLVADEGPLPTTVPLASASRCSPRSRRRTWPAWSTGT